ncbi:MAG: chromate transporter [Clostridiales bacterium]|jgi:chromate transporter|nr:chromate transporter [Clostridiales bacterium]
MTELIQLFFIFAKIGFFTIGGGMAMIPLIQQELVSRGLMSLEQAIDMVAISQMTPGPFAVNCATFSGMQLFGIPGALIATLGVVLPSFVICLLVSKWFFAYRSSPIILSILAGIKPIVLALVLSGLVSIGSASLFPGAVPASIDIPVLAIAAVVSFLLIYKKASPVILVLLSGVFGTIFLR